MYTFPVRYKGSEVLKHIFPSKQKATQTVIDLAKNEPRIQKVVVFGSAVTMNCGMTSDLDIAIFTDEITDDEFLEIVKPFFVEVPSETDIIHYNHIHSELLKKEIDTNGVCVYAKL